MARRHQKADYQSSIGSDDSDKASTGDSQCNTDLTEPEDEADPLQDAGDAALLFADNEHLPEYYVQQLANFDETIYTVEDYGKGTTALLHRVEVKWSQFCVFLQKDPQEEFLYLSIPILYTFLDWILNLRHGKNKRWLPGLKCKSSLDMFWKVFRRVYERETSNKITKQMNRQMRRGGPCLIVIEFTFKFTKEWLGAKDTNTYILPRIFFNPSLILNPHVFLLGLLFADRAFDQVDGEEVLVSANQLPRLQIRDKYNQLRLHLDPALDDIPIFQVSERTLQGIGISPIQPLSYSTLEPLRYGSGTALDSSSISDSLRNIIIHYAGTRTFLRYYLSRRINKNLPAIIRGLNPKDNIMRAAYRMSRTIDPNRPQELTTTQSLSVNQQLEIVKLARRRDELGRQMGRPLSKHEGTI
ncbi:C2H2 finger domain protein [Aspergillus affinis]|uniref:C2H2 finger domain protein n=1 Tax=Aspergillus affinis TaxID=1070780 RepID=UPI0022FF08CB|nr:C2H2 finger domain protein [Aspergillus affinis]KAI9035454.1 C2H2 finger domain protein [Aspergillus affinis]